MAAPAATIAMAPNMPMVRPRTEMERLRSGMALVWAKAGVCLRVIVQTPRATGIAIIWATNCEQIRKVEGKEVREGEQSERVRKGN